MALGRNLSRMTRLSVVTGVAMLTLLGATGVGVGVATADPQARPASDLTVSGDVDAPLTMTPSALRALPNRTQDATFRTHLTTQEGQQRHTYTGALLHDVIAPARPRGDAAAKHPLLTAAVVATGADGYAATLSWGDIDPAVTPAPALVAWMQDGVDLDAPRLVVPGDLTGARYVSELRELRVAQLA
ncbi:molybdopterin-dependent oxidoreductase [Mycolicibacterium goodii]|uniref:molybdopterin-dependent oxidoreductase n=1 Tax=Mycolicibacterium goodii TaxID=134601 RepID=UPI00256EE74F|nr:molybdopterin-dependent oxidoreductase [Mycolicibacterium goodii]